MSTEELQRILDQQIAEGEKYLRELKSQRNETAPISFLPEKILGQIFAFALAGKGPDTCGEYPDPPTADFLSLFNFIYVSQKWRSVAFDTPALWVQPDFRYPDFATIMLEHSKAADLVIEFDVFRMAETTVMEEIFSNHASRIRELNLCGVSQTFLCSILQNLQPSSLRLHSVCVSGPPPRRRNDLPHFPAQLLAQLEDLRHLRLHRCIYPNLYTQPHPLLTHLTVDTPSHLPLQHIFIGALSGMPALETLVMIDSLPRQTVAAPTKVELPRLAFLHLRSTTRFYDVLNALHYFIVPWTTKVHLTCDEVPQSAIVPDIRLALRLFFSCMTGSISRPYHRLRMHNNFSLSVWREKPPGDGSMSIDMPDLDLWLGFGNQTGFVKDLLDSVIPVIPLSHLRELHINSIYGSGPLVNHCSQSPTIQTVELQGNADAAQFLLLLGYRRETDPVAFPALQSLKFYQTNFHELELGWVLDCLIDRYECGAALQDVGIRDCEGIDDKGVSLIREVVIDVEWDGIAR